MPDDSKLKEDMKKALTAVDPAATDPADGEPTDPVDPVDPANGGDTPPADPAKEPDPVPYGRFKEKVDEANTLKEETARLRQENQEMFGQLTDVLKTIKAGESLTPAEKVETKEDIAALVANGEMTQEEANKFLRVLNAADVRRGSATEEKLRKELDETRTTVTKLEKMVLGDKDQQERKSALEKFNGIVTEAQLKERLREMVKAGGGRKIMAEHSDYETIIKTEFIDDIVKAETERVLKTKPKNAPKVDAKKGDDLKKPDEKSIVHDPANPKSFDADLRASIKRQLHSAE